MFAVILIWIYALATTYLLGYAFLRVLSSWPGMVSFKEKKTAKQYDFRYRESYIIAGVVIATVYAEVFSLFAGVGLAANIIMAVVCLLIAVYYRYDLANELKDMIRTLAGGYNGFLYCLIFLLMAYGASHGIMHYDSDLYHAQAIRWIEEYGVVKGLGNVHLRLAYNSSSFAVSALYSMSFLGKGSFHVMSGFFALLLAWQCADIKGMLRRGHIVISDFARIMGIYYLITIYDEMVAPASDYFLSTLVFYIIIHWLDMNVRHVKSYVPYILLTFLSVFAVTVKLSAAPMLILSVIPIYRLLHERTKQKMKAFWISIGISFGIALPFLIRNIILSGWLLYPVTGLDLFGFAYKIPKGAAAYDALEIKTFGRGYNDVAAYGHVPFTEWIPHWFGQMGMLSKIFIILDILSVLVFIGYLVYFLLVVRVEKSDRLKKLSGNKVFDLSFRSMMRMADFLTVAATLIVCLVFWFLSAPLVRYGVVYIWLVPAVILGRTFVLVNSRLSDGAKKAAYRVITVLFCCWLLYKGVNLVIEDKARFNARYLVTQQDYGTYEVKEFKLGNETFYYPTNGDQVGYDPFPSSTHDISGETVMMGENIRDGFKNISY
ncbi:MAG: hypothetical protein K6G10_03535 [Butyrivibrio sp.]|nr:hypothetical protein [Butyrivibrio sp.]